MVNPHTVDSGAMYQRLIRYPGPRKSDALRPGDILARIGHTHGKDVTRCKRMGRPSLYTTTPDAMELGEGILWESCPGLARIGNQQDC